MKLVACDVKLLITDMSENEQMSHRYIGNLSVYKQTFSLNAKQDTSRVQRYAKKGQHDDIII